MIQIYIYTNPSTEIHKYRSSLSTLKLKHFHRQAQKPNISVHWKIVNFWGNYTIDNKFSSTSTFVNHNPFIPSGLSHRSKMDESISNWGVSD